MDNDFVPPSPSVGVLAKTTVVDFLVGDACMFERSIWELQIWCCLTVVKYSRDPGPKSMRLPPATVGQRRVVRDWRRQVPLLISCIQSRSMSATD